MSSSSVLQLKLKCWLKKPLRDDIMEAREETCLKLFYIILLFYRYKKKRLKNLKTR